MTSRKRGLKTIANALFGGNNGSTFITTMSRSSVWPENSLQAEPFVDPDDGSSREQEYSNGIDDIDIDSTSSSDSDSDVASTLSVDQSFAYSLRNLCTNESKLDLICTEGGIKEIIALSKRLDTADLRTRRYSMSIFFSLTQQPGVRHTFLMEGGTGAIVKLLSSTMSSKVQMKTRNVIAFLRHGADAILNLTLSSGEEHRVLDEGAIFATKLIIEHRESKRFAFMSITCSKILHNLTTALCANGEKYITNIVEAFPLDHQGIHKIAMRAFVNLSLKSNQRFALVETGVLLAMTRQLQDEHLPTRPVFNKGTSPTHHAAVAMHNVACSRSCRTEMLNRGVVSALLHLAKCSHHPETILIIVSTLRKLTPSSHLGNQKRIIEDGGIEILEIALQHPDSSVHDEIARHAAKFLNCMASSEGCVQMMIHSGLINVLVELCCVDDSETRNSVASTFSSLTTVTSCHLLLIESRALPALFVIASSVNEEGVKAIFDLAMSFLKISRVDTTRSDAVKAGILLPLISFAQIRSTCVLECCSEALHNLSICSENIESMVCAGVLPALVTMLTLGASRETDYHCVGCAAAIAHFNRDHTKILSEKGLLASIVKSVERSLNISTSVADIQIQFCSFVASLSFKDDARIELRDLGALSIIVAISKIGTDSVRQRCATALCNFSSNPVFHAEMVAADVVQVMSLLSNTYSEKTLRDCAACLCSLSASHEICTETIISNGAFSTILTILMVRSVCGSTRLMCAKVLANLTAERTLKMAFEGGVIQAIEVLINRECGQDKEAVMLVCAKLLRYITQHADGRSMVLRRKSSMSNLLRVIKSNNTAAQLCAGITVCALIRHEQPEHHHSISKETLPIIKYMSTAGNEPSEIACTDALASLATSISGCHWCLQNRAASIIIFLSQSPRKLSLLSAFGAMACMSNQTKLRSSLVEAGLLSVLISNILAGGQILEDIKLDCARILCRLTFSEELHEILVEKRIVIAIVALSKHYGFAHSVVVDQLMAHSLKSLSRSKKIHVPLGDDGGAEILVLLIRRSLRKLSSSDDISSVILDSVSALALVSSSMLMVGTLLVSGVVEALSSLFPKLIANPQICLRASQALASLSKSAAHREGLVDRGATSALVALAHESQSPIVKYHCAEALRNLSMESVTRASMISVGVERVLVDLCVNSNDSATAAHCSAALMNLSAHIMQPKGIVQILLVGKMKAQDAAEFDISTVEEHVDGNFDTASIIQDLLFKLDDATTHAQGKNSTDCTSLHEYTFASPKTPGGCAYREIPPPSPTKNRLPMWQPNQQMSSPCSTFGEENNPIVLEFQKFEA